MRGVFVPTSTRWSATPAGTTLRVPAGYPSSFMPSRAEVLNSARRDWHVGEEFHLPLITCGSVRSDASHARCDGPAQNTNVLLAKQSSLL